LLPEGIRDRIDTLPRIGSFNIAVLLGLVLAGIVLVALVWYSLIRRRLRRR
jgi:hypothetical protein